MEKIIRIASMAILVGYFANALACGTGQDHIIYNIANNTGQPLAVQFLDERNLNNTPPPGAQQVVPSNDIPVVVADYCSPTTPDFTSLVLGVGPYFLSMLHTLGNGGSPDFRTGTPVSEAFPGYSRDWQIQDAIDVNGNKDTSQYGTFNWLVYGPNDPSITISDSFSAANPGPVGSSSCGASICEYFNINNCDKTIFSEHGGCRAVATIYFNTLPSVALSTG